MLRNGQVNTFGGIIYFAVDGTTQEASMEHTKPDSENPEFHNPFLSQANGNIFAEEFEFILTNLLQISNRTKFFKYRSMSGGRFLVSLTEVCTSEKKPGMPIPAQNERQILLMDVIKKNLDTQARGTMWMFLFKNWS